MTSGYTVTPSVYVDESGQEQISYETADVAATSGRERALTDFMQNQEDLYTVDERTGEQIHLYADMAPEYDELLEEFVPIAADDLPDGDIDYIQESVGGAEAYADMMQWAYDTLPADISEMFDNIIDSNDTELILDAVQKIYAMYSSGDYPSPQEGGDYLPEQEYIEEELAPDNTQFVASVYDAFGDENNYRIATQWAEANWAPHMVETYNKAIDTDNPEIIAKAVDMLYNQYFNED